MARKLIVPCIDRGIYCARFSLVKAHIKIGERETATVDAVVDTGAAYTAFSAALLEDLGLKFVRADLPIERVIGGVGSAGILWRGLRGDLVLGGKGHPQAITLRDAQVFFSQQNLQFPAVIGQDDTLYRLHFAQSNYTTKRRSVDVRPHFQLVEP